MGTFSRGVLVLSLLGIYPAYSAADPADDVRVWVEAHVPQMMRDSSMPGFSIAVVKDGATIYSSGFGARDPKKGLPAIPVVMLFYCKEFHQVMKRLTSKRVFCFGSVGRSCAMAVRNAKVNILDIPNTCYKQNHVFATFCKNYKNTSTATSDRREKVSKLF